MKKKLGNIRPSMQSDGSVRLTAVEIAVAIAIVIICGILPVVVALLIL